MRQSEDMDRKYEVRITQLGQNATVKSRPKAQYSTAVHKHDTAQTFSVQGKFTRDPVSISYISILLNWQTAEVLKSFQDIADHTGCLRGVPATKHS